MGPEYPPMYSDVAFQSCSLSLSRFRPARPLKRSIRSSPAPHGGATEYPVASQRSVKAMLCADDATVEFAAPFQLR
jgi:streptogramin lyase